MLTDTHLARRDLAFLFIAVSSIVVALLLSVLFTLWQVTSSQHRWCDVLVTLDNADRRQPPTTDTGRTLFADFHKPREQYGCGG